MTNDDKISDEKLQYDIIREAAGEETKTNNTSS